MTSIHREEPDYAPLAGALAPVSKGARSSRMMRKALLFPGLSRRVYEEPIVSGWTVFGPYLVVSDPSGVRQVLVEKASNYPKASLDVRFFRAIFGGGLLGLDGEAWRRHRRIMAPSFDPRSVSGYGPAMAQTAQDFCRQWRAMGEGADIDMAHEMTLLTFKVIARTVFSADGEPMIDMIRGALSSGVQAAAAANLLDLVPVIRSMRMSARERRMQEASKALDQAIAELVADRETHLADAPQDLLTRLIASKDEGGAKGLTAKEIRDEIVTIFMAGHETTANALTWIWYILSERPGQTARLHAELDQVLQGRDPALSDLPSLPFTRRVVEEAMRLYPAAPALSMRRALQKDDICGHKVAKGAAVSIAPWILHRHRGLWENPDAFDPDRFTPERSAGRPRFSYLPFGAGPRVCIGQMLAMNETILLLATLAQGFNPKMAPDARVVPRANITLQMRYGLKMILYQRTASVPQASA